MLRLKLEQFEGKADEKGYMQETGRVSLMEMVVQDADRERLIRALAISLNVSLEAAHD